MSGDSTKLFHIYETDLAVLEAELPRLMDACGLRLNDTLTRKRWEMVKSIVSNVRWEYGPPLEVEHIRPDDTPPAKPA